MTGLLFIAMIAAGAALFALFRRVESLERLVADLQDRLHRLDPDRQRPTPRPESHTEPRADPRDPLLREPATIRPSARIVAPAPAIATDIAPRPEPEPKPEAAPAEPARPVPPALPLMPAPEPVRLGFEQIVGGKLPIWIGGAALVLSAFFLVRFSIENGLLGPVARTIIAALFGLVLIAASEVARRLAQTRDDPRIAQALAGAGIASLYGTLYIAAELYGLIGAVAAFVLMAAVTAVAMGLALRHGPPTAIMALIGGFAAPLVAGFESAGIGPLLAYLGLLVAALFGLAIRRGWVWLALAACGGGFAWVNLLVATLEGRDLAGVGGFVLLLAIGATLALPRTGAARPWLRLLPLLAGLMQLLILAPALDFGPLAWGLYLLLSGSALWLAWRDETLAPGAAAALALVLLLLGVGLDQDSASAPYAAIGVTLLFAIPGHLRALHNRLWAGIALAAAAGPVLIANLLAHHGLPPAGWAALLTLAAAACAWLSWRDRSSAMPKLRAVPALSGGAALAAVLFGVALYELLPLPWLWPAWLGLGVALAAWSRRTEDGALARIALAPAAVTALAVVAHLSALHAYLASVFGTAALPPIADLLAIGLLPPLLFAATARLLPHEKPRIALDWIAWLLALAFVPAVLPAPWHAASLGLATLAAILARLPQRTLIAALLATLAAVVPHAVDLLWLMMNAIGGDRLPWLRLPPLAAVLRDIALPGALIATGLVLRRPAFGNARPTATAIVALAGVAGLYAIVKQPLAIATLPRFETWGFVERAILTQFLFAAAWAARKPLPRLARRLLALALARFVWFDLILLDPLVVRQSVGSLPLLNAAVLHAALVAAWLWPDRHRRYWLSAMLAAVALTVAVAVRQLTHGSDLSGAMGRAENWLYSAAFLGLSLVWLTRGIMKGIADLRIAGLSLLTLVTLKVFLVDASALEGILRILSFLGLGLALMSIGWAYSRFVAKETNGTVTSA